MKTTFDIYDQKKNHKIHCNISWKKQTKQTNRKKN